MMNKYFFNYNKDGIQSSDDHWVLRILVLVETIVIVCAIISLIKS
ncbi:hypothetical protein N6H18_11130 [Reichenbachiella agarivorans]|uniref:Uncharacterized protein n=1 Tax=Reichenbachiella agarivorans TaxID=2979464 RepID=A0ABY6CK73_9BACT|nr:hypothetical protein [Reichenbachiella agarivorans]UXP30903.1 hypothetical protein N6H18_11130 [Reichenbachiella agarivorans]